MNKTTQLKILRGANAKLSTLRVLIMTHYNAEGWDTDADRDRARCLYNDIAEMMNTLREETA